MNAHPKFVMAQSKLTSWNGKKVSRAELARFLARLADMYNDPKTGNRALSVALHELSDELAKTSRVSRREIDRRSPPPATATVGPPLDETDLQPTFKWLRNLNVEDVKRFISDETKSKSELIEIATERFSIPRSRLMRLSTSAVREEIRSALLHEESLTIISQEAERSGASRSS